MLNQVIKKNAYQHAISSTLFLFTLCTSTQLFAQSTALWPTFTKDQKYAIAEIKLIEEARNDENGKYSRYIESKDPLIVAHTLYSAARIKNTNVQTWATQALKSDQAMIRQAGLFALSLSQNVNVQTWIDTLANQENLEEQQALIAAIGRKGEFAQAQTLIKKLKDPKTSEKLHTHIFYALSHMASRKIEFACPEDEIEKALFTTDNDLKISALTLIAQSNNCSKANAFALQLVQDENEDVRRLALSIVSGPDAIAKAYQVLSSDPSARVALAVIKHLKGKDGELILVKALNDLLTQLKSLSPIEPAKILVYEALLEHALSLAYSADIRKVSQQIADFQKSIKEGAESIAPAFDLAHIHCRASALMDSQKGEPNHLLRCSTLPELKPLIEKLSLKLIESQGSARKQKSLIKFYPNASVGVKISILSDFLEEKLPKEAIALIKEALNEEHPELLKLAVKNIIVHKITGLEQELVNLCSSANLRGQNEVLAITLDALGDLKVEGTTKLFEQLQLHPNSEVRKKAEDAMMKVNGNLARIGTKSIKPPPGESNPPSVSWAEKSPYLRAIVETSKGSFQMTFLSDHAVQTVKTFSRLVEKGFYEQKSWCDQLIGQWLIGGAPNDEPYAYANQAILNEENEIPFERFVVGMLQNERDQGNGAFVIALERNFDWDMRYTPFAYIDEGQDVLSKLQLGDKIIKIELKKN